MNDPVSSLAVLELALRGGASGICLLSALRLIRRAPRFGASNLGTAFCFCTAIYAVISTPHVAEIPGSAFQFLLFFATINSVVFWWFATALFDDSFSWNVWRFVPFGFLVALFVGRMFTPETVKQFGGSAVQQSMVIAMMLHAVWLAIANRADDLIEPRRRFRPVFAFLVGLTGLIIAIAELSIGSNEPQAWLSLLHAVALFVLALTFVAWLTGPIELFPTGRGPVQTKFDGVAIDDPARLRLEAAMKGGTYREEGLTIAALANRIAYPEYKLRHLINRALGFRNFSAFLNSYRIKDAKVMLADQSRARVQVTQIAFDLGYGSIATFNRAFKTIEGVTPSDFRKRAHAGELNAAQ